MLLDIRPMMYLTRSHDDRMVDGRSPRLSRARQELIEDAGAAGDRFVNESAPVASARAPRVHHRSMCRGSPPGIPVSRRRRCSGCGNTRRRRTVRGQNSQAAVVALVTIVPASTASENSPADTALVDAAIPAINSMTNMRNREQRGHRLSSLEGCSAKMRAS